MRKRAKDENMVESGDVRLPVDEEIPSETGVDVLLPDLDAQRTYRVMSPRLAHKNQAKDFVHEVIEEAPDATL